MQTALALRQAIWHKADPYWRVCGIPGVFYTDHGADVTSRHLEQVAADIEMRLVFSEKGEPRGRGKIERFFETVNQLFLCDLPGYTPPGTAPATPTLTLPELDERLHHVVVVVVYHRRPHSETGQAPFARWEAGGFLPRLPDALEQLDLLLLTAPKPRQVHQDGIHLHGPRYIDLTLAAYVGEDVVVRFDPRDMAEVRVYHQSRFLCRAICQELADRSVGLKDIIRARAERRRPLRARLSEREALVEALLAVHRPPPDPDLPPASPADFIVTKAHRRFVEFCDACRRYRYIGLCHGAPGVGKTLSAQEYARWDLVEAPASSDLPSAEVPREFITERTIVYTPSVANAPRQVERTVQGLRRRVNALAIRALQAQDVDGPGEADRVPDLIIVDEADRLRMAGLEQLRDLYDQGARGLIFIGMPGLEKRLARDAHLYSRVGFVHQFRALSTEEMQFILAHKWAQLGLTLSADDVTDTEAVAAIVRVTGGNVRLIQRLFTHIERILQINAPWTVTKEVVEAARESLVIGPL